MLISDDMVTSFIALTISKSVEREKEIESDREMLAWKGRVKEKKVNV